MARELFPEKYFIADALFLTVFIFTSLVVLSFCFFGPGVLVG